ncbi:MAG: cupin domain-containing protein [Gammaproteobacteria bacterium]
MNTARVVTADEMPRTEVAAGEATDMQVLIGSDHAPHFAMRRFTMAPGGSMPAHTNTVEHEQFVLTGSAEVGIDGEIYQVKAGDVVFIPAGSPHWYRTVGEEAFSFLCLVPNQDDRIDLVPDGC